MKKPYFFILATFLFSGLTLFSQKTLRGTDAEITVAGAEQVIINEQNHSLKFVVMKNNSFVEEANHLNWLKTKVLKLNSDYDLVLYKKERDNLGYTHYRYKEIYKGIKVESGVYYVHVKDGRVISVNGEFYSTISQNLSSIVPKINKTTALNEAKLLFSAKNILDYSEKHKELTILYKKNIAHLCYHFELCSKKPLKHSEIFVDAQSNKVVLELNKIHTTDVPGTLTTQYNGTKTVTIDQVSGSQYRLQEAAKNISTKNCNNSTSPFSAVDFTNTSANWTATTPINKAVFDLHYGLEKTYDYYNTKFSRNSYDGNGTQIQGIAHYDYNFDNAFWDGTYMVFGDGDGTSYNPFSTTDIVGHELTHAVTESSAGLLYQDESGGLNESFSDIFGVSVDFFANPGTANFLEGEQCSMTNTPFRDMTNPKATYQPDTYMGQYWISSGGSDNGGVHTNSQVQNHWYYLLCQGGSGTNDNSVSYNVSGIGIADAEKIAYRNLTNYLTPNSTFDDARTYAIQSAIDLFGSCSNQVTQCSNAWYAVGVGSGLYSNAVVADFSSNVNFSCSVPASVSFINNSVNATSYVWQFGDGSTSTSTNPAHTYTAAGTYSVKLKAIGTTSCNTNDSILKINYLTVTNSGAPVSACIPIQASSTMGYGITKVEFGSISKNSGDATEGYKDFTCANQTTLTAGNPYLIKITTPGNYERVAVWIDYNNDGTLNSGNELVFNSLNSSNSISTHTAIIHTPTTAVLNTPLRMRVYDDYMNISNSCSSHGYGQTEDYTVRFSASNTAPIANFYSNTRTIQLNGTVNFYDSTLNVPTNYKWEFQGGSPSTSTALNPNVIYNAIGTYSVKLKVSNAFGADSITKIGYIQVVNSYNMCTGTTSTSASAGNLFDSGGPNSSYQNSENCQFLINPGCTGTISVTFSQFVTESCCDQLSVYNGTNTSAPLLGYYSGSTIPPTLYASSGKMLFVWNTDGSVTNNGFAATWTSTLSGTIPPVASFSVSTTTPAYNSNVQFTDHTTNSPYLWYWQFGDGTTSTVQNPLKAYATSGIKTITLTATNCSTTSISTQTLNVQAAPNLVVNPSSVSGTVNCGDSLMVPITLTNNGSGDLVYNSSINGSSDSVKVLVCTYGVDMSAGGDYYKTLNAISSYYTKYSVTQYSGNTSAGLQTALINKNVVLFPRQTTNTDAHYYTYSSVLNSFATNGGSVVFCGSNGVIGNTRPFNTGLFSGTYNGALTNYSSTVLLPNDSLMYGIGVSTFNGDYNYLTITDASKITPLTITSYTYDVVSYKNIGTGKAIFIGCDFYNTNNKFAYILARAIKTAKTTSTNLSYLSPATGTLNATQTQTANVVIKTYGQPAGVYTTTLAITGNNPSPNPYLVPVTYTINGAATSSVSANCVGFGSIVQYTTKKDSVMLYNLGCATLSVSSISNTNSVFTYTPASSFTIAAWASKKIYVRFNPSTVGVFSDTLRVINNGGNLKICMTGTSTIAPAITITPTSITTTLSACNNTTSASLNIGNVGGSNLTYSVSGSTTTGSINVLVIMNNISSTNYQNMLNGLNSYSTNYSITQHTLTNVTSLQNALVGKQVLLIPQSTNGYTTGQFQTYSTTIANFVSGGGTTIMSGLYANTQVNDVGLFNSTYTNYLSSGNILNVIDTNDVIMKFIPMTNVYSSNYSYYNSITNTDAVDYIKYSSYSMVSKRIIGQGRAILLASDFAYSDNIASRILSNCVKSAGSTNPAWLTNTATNSTITPGSTSVVTYTFNSGTLSSGTYTTTIYITSNDPLVPTFTVPVTMIVDNNPCANFAYTSSNNCTGIVTFTNNSVNTVTSYNWNFGNGTNSTVANPTITYGAAGIYSITLTACNGTLCSSSTQTVSITGVGGPITNSCTPTSYQYGSNVGILNVTFNTINKSSSYAYPEGYQDFSCNDKTTLTIGNTYTLIVTTGPSYYENVSAWIDFNNDGAFASTEQILNSLSKLTTHTLSFTPPATAVLNTPLRMRITDDQNGYTIYNSCYNSYYGQTEDYTIKIQPNNVPPIASFNTQVNSCQGTVNFTDNSLNSPTTWLWNFGDGNASSAQNPSYTYSASGTYTVLLIASNAYGSNYISQIVTVNPLSFNIAVTGSLSVNQPLTYTTNLNGALAYTWDFGDGTLSGNQTATHTYTAVGTYTVKLTVISSNCVNTQTTTVTISVDAGIQENNESFGFNVFPNPFNSNTSIKLKIYRETELGMEIFNSIGQKVKTISDKKTYQEGEYNYSTDFLAKGIYFLKVNFKEKTYIYKLISIE